MITIKDLKKRFEDVVVFDGLNLKTKVGQITAIFGPNGCGKSTLLQIISGLEGYEEDDIYIQNHRVNFDPANLSLNHGLSYVFQHPNLFPWLNSFHNIAFPLKVRKIKKKEIDRQVAEMYQLFNCNFDLSLYPYQLSGGQRRLVSLMRHLVTNPTVLLLDEPFSALDDKNRFHLYSLLQNYYLSKKPTILLITHNAEEAAYLASRIIVMTDKPTQIAGEVYNPLSYPRTLETLKTEEFRKVEDEILSISRSTVTI